MAKTLIKIDRNGSKHYIEQVDCPRCGGKGIYYIGSMNGKLLPSWVENGICFQCAGAGKVDQKTIERTPEYEAKLEAKRIAKRKRYEEEHAEEIRKAEEERQKLIVEEEARRIEEERLIAEEEARKANSNFFGSVGEKIEKTMTFNYSARFEVPSFSGYGMDTKYIHNFTDEDGNTFVWKTGSSIARLVDEKKDIWEHPEKGDKVTVKGTIKEHSEYAGEKQTVLIRCKVSF